MRMQEIRKQIKHELGPFMKDRGFLSDKEGTGFVRNFDRGFHWFVVGVYNYAPLYKLDFGGSVRLDAVEEILQHVMPVDSDLEKQKTTIFLNRKLIDGPEKKFIEFMEPDELQGALEYVRTVFDAKYIPFFDQCVDVKSVFDLVCSDRSFNSMAPPGCWYRDVILASLNQSPLFEKWAEYYLEKLIHENDKRMFAQLVDMLRPIASGEKKAP